MTTARPGSKAEADHLEAEAAFAAFIRRLAHDAATLRAIKSGKVDAILDPASGTRHPAAGGPGGVALRRGAHQPDTGDSAPRGISALAGRRSRTGHARVG